MRIFNKTLTFSATDLVNFLGCRHATYLDVLDLEDSYLLVQGPPGTGKTYLSAHAIVDLLAQGQRIGVSSNSHKAINNLLVEVEKQALDRKLLFRGAKKSPAEDHHLNGAMIVDVITNEEISDGNYDLIAGTVWMFARPEFHQSLDYLFIDEAGQVSIANVVAMGLSARNIVLVGDQMQLAQPAQGVHLGDSGKSALDFLLGDIPTVPPERGIFLPVTRRMHPDVCRFISEAVYEGRLQPKSGNANQRLVLAPGADAALKSSGIAWVPVAHGGCSQKSEEEGARIKQLYASLLNQRWIDREGVEAPIRPADILVVSPYNMQVNLLKSGLPTGARVGTVDKFQGQEAAVVLVSMTTSSAEDISRGMDFLYSRNRLNVAISRAKSLAIVVANPKLLEAGCNTIEQLKLVNTLCFVKAYAEG
jgi:superfamily I DNA and/or RNA helicase